MEKEIEKVEEVKATEKVEKTERKPRKSNDKRQPRQRQQKLYEEGLFDFERKKDLGLTFGFSCDIIP